MEQPVSLIYRWRECITDNFKPSAATSPYQALIALEKSHGTSLQQIQEAASIVHFKIPSDTLTQQDNATEPRSVSAREDWLLRWLLKKLKGSKRTAADFRLLPESWRLMCIVIESADLSNTARTVNEQIFLATLKETLQDLEQGLTDTLERFARSGSQRLPSESSLSAQESPSLSSVKAGKKRKRSGTIVIESPPRSPLDSTQLYLDTFHDILNASAALINLSSAQGHKGDEIAKQHMRSALHTDASTAAQILGRVLSIMRVVELSAIATPTQISDMIRTLPSIIQLWEMRSKRDEDVADLSSKVNGQQSTLYMIATT